MELREWPLDTEETILDASVSIGDASIFLEANTESITWVPRLTVRCPSNLVSDVWEILAPTRAWVLPRDVVLRELQEEVLPCMAIDIAANCESGDTDA